MCFGRGEIGKVMRKSEPRQGTPNGCARLLAARVARGDEDGAKSIHKELASMQSSHKQHLVCVLFHKFHKRLHTEQTQQQQPNCTDHDARLGQNKNSDTESH